MKLVWHALAEAEFDEAVDYYLLHAGADIGRKFSTALNNTLVLLKDHPAIGALTRNQARRMPIHGFPFDLVYRVEAERIAHHRHRQPKPPARVLGRAAVSPQHSLSSDTPAGMLPSSIVTS